MKKKKISIPMIYTSTALNILYLHREKNLSYFRMSKQEASLISYVRGSNNKYSPCSLLAL